MWGQDQGSEEERDHRFILLASSSHPVLFAAELCFLPSVSTVPLCGSPSGASIKEVMTLCSNPFLLLRKAA